VRKRSGPFSISAERRLPAEAHRSPGNSVGAPSQNGHRLAEEIRAEFQARRRGGNVGCQVRNEGHRRRDEAVTLANVGGMCGNAGVKACRADDVAANASVAVAEPKSRLQSAVSLLQTPVTSLQSQCPACKCSCHDCQAAVTPANGGIAVANGGAEVAEPISQRVQVRDLGPCGGGGVIAGFSPDQAAQSGSSQIPARNCFAISAPTVIHRVFHSTAPSKAAMPQRKDRMCFMPG